MEPPRSLASATNALRRRQVSGQRALSVMAANIATRGARTVVMGILFCAIAANLSASDKITINIHQSDDVIKRQLLQLTPIGTSAKEVFQFLQSRLHHDRDSHISGAPGQPFRSTMSIYLGHYFELRGLSEGLFMFPTVVQATWRFDENDKLRDIRVRRFIRGW